MTWVLKFSRKDGTVSVMELGDELCDIEYNSGFLSIQGPHVNITYDLVTTFLITKLSK